MIGECIGRRLGGGDIVAEAGGLGAGKTCLTQGIARGLGIPETEIVSPTYTLIREAAGRVRLYHVDLYRLKDLDDLENTGFYDAFHEDAVTVIEWADRFPGAIREPHLAIRLGRVDERVREVFLEAHGDRYCTLMEKILETVKQEMGTENHRF